jgi:GTP1/Obg family GTP-binding protein
LKKPLYVVINKIDTKAITEVNKVEQLIRKTLIDEGVIVNRFIRFSEKEPLESIMEPIRSVEHNVEEDSYIDKLDTLLEDSVKIKENDKDAAFRLYNKKSHEVEEYTSRMNVLLQNLTGNCDNVNKIPQFKEGLEIFLKLTDDKYEMNEYQYRKFVDLLGSIKTQARNMNSISNSCTKAVKEQQKLYEDYNDKRESFRNAFACLQKFKKLRKELEHKIL